MQFRFRGAGGRGNAGEADTLVAFYEDKRGSNLSERNCDNLAFLFKSVPVKVNRKVNAFCVCVCYRNLKENPRIMQMLKK